MGKTLRKRFWLGASAVALFVFTLAVANPFLSADRKLTRTALGHDFIAFYTAGHFLNAGRPELVYDLGAVREFQQHLARHHGVELRAGYAPFWNPPFFAYLFRPLAVLPYPAALSAWWAISIAAFAGSAAVLWRMFRPQATSDGALLVLLLAVSLPALQALGHGQNSYVSLLLLSGIAALWLKASANGKDGPFAFQAGLLAGLLFYKPQLALAVAIVMCLTLGRRAVLGLLVTGTLLAAFSCYAAPDLLADWLTRMPRNLAAFQEESRYLWERHVTLKAFFRLLIQHRDVGADAMVVKTLTVVSTLGLASALALATVRTRRILTWSQPMAGPHPPGLLEALAETRRTAASRLIAATVCSMPLLMPFYFDYDLLMLAVPATLLAGDVLRHGARRRADRWLVRAWVGLYLYSYVSPALAARSFVHVEVLLLAAVALLQIGRVMARAERVVPVPVARARDGDGDPALAA